MDSNFSASTHDAIVLLPPLAQVANWGIMLRCDLRPTGFQPELLVLKHLLHQRLPHCWAHVPPDGSPTACVLPDSSKDHDTYNISH